MPIKVCKLSFLQQIFAGKKKCLLQKDVPSTTVPHWPQLAVKEIYPKAVEAFPEISEYMSDSGDNSNSFPPRDFFYGVLGALKPKELGKLIKDACELRIPQKENLQEQKWRMAISDEWVDKLL